MMKFMPFDRINYVGDKFKSSLAGKVGEVVCPVGGEDNAYVVEIADDSYLLSGDSLVKARFSDKEKEPEVRRQRRREEES